MERKRALGDFLQARRCKLNAAELGLPNYGRRRVPGLRREEVAQLAGVSVDYYLRLEQGRAGHPSAQVIEALAQALRLSADERLHLLHLNQLHVPADQPIQTASPRNALINLLEAITTVPALIYDRYTTISAVNKLARQLWLLDEEEETNLARLIFLHPKWHEILPEWTQTAREMTGALRFAFGQHPNDIQLQQLILELQEGSPVFAGWWAQQAVQQRSHGVKVFLHPVAGPLTLNYESFRLPDDSDSILVMYHAQAGDFSKLKA